MTVEWVMICALTGALCLAVLVAVLSREDNAELRDENARLRRERDELAADRDVGVASIAGLLSCGERARDPQRN